MRDKPIGNTETCVMLVLVTLGAISCAAAALIVLVQAGAQVVPW